MRLSALLFCMFAVAPAMAQDSYPARPVKILVPYGPGGATDIIARIVAQKLTESLGQAFLVENRPGANGNLALEAAAKAPPDGYTLLVGNVSTNAINENIFAHQLQIKPSRDLVGIAKLVEIPHIVVASASFAPNTIAELIAAAKREPGKINFASVGLGSYPHLDMERLMKAAGIELTHVPYKGGAGQAIPAMIAGEVQVAFFNMASLLPHIRSGRLKALAAIPAQRLPELPNVPTLAEQGFPGIGTNAWQGMFAPAATPKPLIERLHGAIVAVLTRPEQKEALAKQMMIVEVSKSPQEFTDLVRRETLGWGEFLREARIKID
ncbi:MAG: tripartite tricarboxylate transporter substrate binding protein [Betaproteobacteria bacterium]|nr:MAG: tripartite tricarboxylate transporter substrate binding protein [Betaproteobacteria bacterium]